MDGCNPHLLTCAIILSCHPAGARQLALVVGGLAVLMPPAATLLTQTLLVLLVRNADAYCASQARRPLHFPISAARRRPCCRSTPPGTSRPCDCRCRPAPFAPPAQLLEDPLTQQRLGAAITGLEYATLPMLLLQPLFGAQSPVAASMHKGAGLSMAARRATRPQPARPRSQAALTSNACAWPAAAAGLAAPAALCRSGLAFSELGFVIIVPTLVSVYTWQPPSAGRVAAAAGGRPGTPAWVLRGGAAAFGAANRLLHWALCCPDGTEARWVVAWWLLSIAWWLCKRTAGLS